MAGELFFLPNQHLLTRIGKQVDVGLGGELFFQPNLNLLTLIGKQAIRVSRCRFGAKIIFRTKSTSTYSYLKMSNKSE
jgi:hypothetical protein